MIGTNINHDAAISNFTLAVLKDTNWYKITNESRVDPLFWGRNKGCDFPIKACQNTNFAEFSTVAQEGCGFYHNGLSRLAYTTFFD